MASPQFVGGSVNSLTVGWRRCEYHMPMAAAAAPAAAMLAIPSRAPHEVSAERLVVYPGHRRYSGVTFRRAISEGISFATNRSICRRPSLTIALASAYRYRASSHILSARLSLCVVPRPVSSDAPSGDRASGDLADEAPSSSKESEANGE